MKEKGEFDKSLDCMKWAYDNAAIPVDQITNDSIN
jgi:hypothetical protein